MELWSGTFGSECTSLYSHYFGISNISRTYRTTFQQEAAIFKSAVLMERSYSIVDGLCMHQGNNYLPQNLGQDMEGMLLKVQCQNSNCADQLFIATANTWDYRTTARLLLVQSLNAPVSDALTNASCSWGFSDATVIERATPPRGRKGSFPLFSSRAWRPPANIWSLYHLPIASERCSISKEQWYTSQVKSDTHASDCTGLKERHGLKTSRLGYEPIKTMELPFPEMNLEKTQQVICTTDQELRFRNLRWSVNYIYMIQNIDNKYQDLSHAPETSTLQERCCSAQRCWAPEYLYHLESAHQVS